MNMHLYETMLHFKLPVFLSHPLGLPWFCQVFGYLLASYYGIVIGIGNYGIFFSETVILIFSRISCPCIVTIDGAILITIVQYPLTIWGTTKT